MPDGVQGTKTGDQLLAYGALLGRSGKIIESEISGTSMGNTLPEGCRIRIQPMPLNEYRAGQIVAFVFGNALFAHRIVYCSRQGVLTRGDNHSMCDLPVPFNAFLGVVTEYLSDEKWRLLRDVIPLENRRQWTTRTAEFLLRMCMCIDIRLARKASNMLIWFAHVRRQLVAQIARTR